MWPAGLGKWSFPLPWYWWDCVLSTVFSFGPSLHEGHLGPWRYLQKVKEYKSHEEWQRELGLLTLEKRRPWGDLIALYKSLKGGGSWVGVGLFSQVTSDRMRVNGPKLHKNKVSLDIWKTFLHKPLEQATQGSGRVLIPGRVPKICEHGTWGHGLRVVGLSWCLELMILEVFSNKGHSWIIRVKMR